METKKFIGIEYNDIVELVHKTMDENGIKGATSHYDYDSQDDANPLEFIMEIPSNYSAELVMRACNKIFHALELLPADKDLALGELGDYCDVLPPQADVGYIVSFNDPVVFTIDKTEQAYKYILKNWRDWDEEKETKFEIKNLVDELKTKRSISGMPEEQLIIDPESYDAIDSGTKKVEHLEFIRYYIMSVIGRKIIRFSRSNEKGAKQMRWEIEKVVLLDGENNECDPFNVPEDFWPTTIAIHLGNRIGRPGDYDGVLWLQPSKEMAAALDANGLDIIWPEYIYVPIKGTFRMPNGQEKSVMINLRCGENFIKLTSEVDRSVAHCLYAAYMEFNWKYEAERDIEEMKSNSDMSLDSLVRLLEDKQEQEKCLYRFWQIAATVASARPEDWKNFLDETFHILPEKDAEIERLCPKLEPGTGAWCGVVVPLAHSLGISEDSSDNVKRGDKCLTNGTGSISTEQ